jgi:NAD(P)-dependent dehydrogenase (short-subunit alcohol dehydrogenase family)
MQTFKDQVAVITGAASGIGWALAQRCAQDGMKVVLADIQAGALEKAESKLRTQGAAVLAVQTDVSLPEQVEHLAQQTLAHFGGVHLLCCNAGIGTGTSPIWSFALEDWRWLLDVNLLSVVYGIRSFVPVMIRQNEPAHVVITSSISGIVDADSAYAVTKHAAVALAETLDAHLRERNLPIGVSVLCPAFVKTKILSAARNRPAHLPKAAKPKLSPEDVQRARDEAKALRDGIAQGMNPAEIAEHVFQAIHHDRFYILPHEDWNNRVQARMDAILRDLS